MARKASSRRSTASKGTAHDDDGERTTSLRGLWSGSISFGLLQIPVTLYTAESPAEEIHFRQLDKHDLAPIRYERVNASTGKAVAWKDIVKGYEYEPDNYVVLEPDDLKKANVKATQTIDIQDFVPADQIDPAYFETPYFIVPQKRATKAYVLLREALKTKNAAAVARFVLRTREHLAALLPVGDAIMLEVLRFGHELRKSNDLPLPTESAKAMAIGPRELAMAEQLIEGMMTDWTPSKYRDRFHADVMKMIEAKAKTGKFKAQHTQSHGVVANDVVDLLDLLKRSVSKGKGKAANDDDDETSRSRTRRAAPKKTTRRRPAKKTEAA